MINGMTSALVSGASRGIGRAISLALAGRGVRLCLVGRSEDALRAAAEECREHGADAEILSGDLTDRRFLDGVGKSAEERIGPVDILINNSGVIEGNSIDQVSDEQWEKVISVNVTGMFKCIREGFKYMKSRGGKIINIGSIAGETPRMFSSPYTTSKHAVRGLTKSAALDGRELGISVSCLNPGNTKVDRRADGRSGSGRDEGPEILIEANDIAKIGRAHV